MGRILLQVLIFVVVFAVAFGVVASVRGALVRRSARRRAERDRATPWTPYTRMEPGSVDWRIGVERVTEGGDVLNRVEMHMVPVHHEIAKLEAVGDAIHRASLYNETRAGM